MSWINICDIIYPVGAYYISHDSTPPSELFGGTWTAVTGRFLYCNAGTDTGGSNTHTLTVDQIPSHNHRYRHPCLIWVGSGGTEDWPTGGTHRASGTDKYSSSSSYLTDTGGGAAHNNMPAYQTVYAWRRIA